MVQAEAVSTLLLHLRNAYEGTDQPTTATTHAIADPNAIPWESREYMATRA